MKASFQVEISVAAKKDFFPQERIKSKYKILEILLEACRYMMYNNKEEKVVSKDKIILKTDKMNRLFFVSGGTKIYSIAFPFSISYEEENMIIRYRNGFAIDSGSITNLLSIIKSPIMGSNSCLEFIDPILDLESNANTNYWEVLRDLLLLEDGYLRYDKDEKGYEEAVKNDRAHKHPLNHIDIFYTNPVTFKLGLENDFLDEEFVDTVDSTTDCRYLKPIVRQNVNSPKKS